MGYFIEYKLEQIPKELNENADALAKLAFATDSEFSHLIPVELLNEPSINFIEQVLTIQFKNTWMMPIVKYLKGNGLLDNQLEAWRVKARAA